jgi:hypothetical protein
VWDLLFDLLHGLKVSDEIKGTDIYKGFVIGSIVIISYCSSPQEFLLQTYPQL